MSAGKLRLIVNQGETFAKTIKLKDVNGTPIDLTGYSARMQARLEHASAAPVLSISSSSGGIVVQPSGEINRLDLLISAAETAQLQAPFLGVYDLEIEDSSGVVSRLLEGQLRITPEVTR